MANLSFRLNVFHQELVSKFALLKAAESYAGPYDIYQFETDANQLETRIGRFRVEPVSSWEAYECNALFSRIQKVFQELKACVDGFKKRAISEIAPLAKTRADYSKVDKAFVGLGLIKSEMGTGPMTRAQFESVCIYDAYISGFLGNHTVDTQLRDSLQSAVDLAKIYSM